MYLPEVQTRQTRSCQGRMRTMYRYGSAGPWYSALYLAQIAYQRKQAKRRAWTVELAAEVARRSA